MRNAVCILLAIAAVFCSETAIAQSTYKTSTSVWDLQVQQSPITLDANMIYVSGTGVRLGLTSTSGVASFVSTNAPWSCNNVVASWNVDEPAGTGFRTEVRAVNGGTTTAWYEIRRDGTIPGSAPSAVKSDSYGSIDDDTLMLNSRWPRIEYRVTLYSNTVGVTPTLRLMSLCYADSKTLITDVDPAPPGVTTSLPVPWRSQYWVPDIGWEICGPTSMSMAEAYNGCNLDTAIIAADCYDDLNGIYGNWPCIAQGAAKHGFKSYYSRGNNQQPVRDLIAQGYPVEIGMAYNAGQLTNSPISSTSGHLVLCVGIAANGDWICDDPAGSTTFWDHVDYLKSEIATVWGTHGGTIIPCIPNCVYYRYPYYPYKSSDPVSTNKLGEMEIFARGVDWQIYHMCQSSINGGFGAWSSLAGTAASDPVAVTNRTGGNTVFARFTDNNLYYNWQNGSNGAWSGWTSLGGPIAGKPAVGKSPDGRMDVFCRMADGTIQHKWESTSSGWQSWASLGGSYPGDPIVGLNWEGREEVFVRGSNSQLYHAWQINDGSWSSWASLGGTVAGEPTVGKISDGRIEIYCRFTDGTMQHNWQTTLGVGATWNGWTALGGSTTYNLAAGRTPAFMQEIYCRDSSGAINRAYQSSVDGSLSAWQSLNGSSLGAPIIGHNDDGRIQVFAVQSDGRMYTTSQTTGGGWSGWGSTGTVQFPESIPPTISGVSISPYLNAAGDTVTVSANATDNVSVAGVTLNGVAMTNQGGGTWSGSITAATGLGQHAVTIAATDTSGNTTTSNASYTTTKVYALSNLDAFDPTAIAAAQYLFAVYGAVTVVNSGQFTVDDGSGVPVTVYAPNHGLSNGQHVRARGMLVSDGLGVHVNSSVGFIRSMD